MSVVEQKRGARFGSVGFFPGTSEPLSRYRLNCLFTMRLIQVQSEEEVRQARELF
jgi:hypothetical protein